MLCIAIHVTPSHWVVARWRDRNSPKSYHSQRGSQIKCSIGRFPWIMVPGQNFLSAAAVVSLMGFPTTNSGATFPLHDRALHAPPSRLGIRPEQYSPMGPLLAQLKQGRTSILLLLLVPSLAPLSDPLCPCSASVPFASLSLSLCLSVSVILPFVLGWRTSTRTRRMV